MLIGWQLSAISKHEYNLNTHSSINTEKTEMEVEQNDNQRAYLNHEHNEKLAIV